eukprot:1064587-Prymnesium_polylepis.2
MAGALPDAQRGGPHHTSFLPSHRMHVRPPAAHSDCVRHHTPMVVAQFFAPVCSLAERPFGDAPRPGFGRTSGGAVLLA